MERTISDLTARHCTPCEGGTPPLARAEVARYLAALPGWAELEGTIAKLFEFKDYWQTMAFVNAVAWIAHSENHHPDLEVSYRRCLVRYTTHGVAGLSENDFICAARVDALL